MTHIIHFLLFIIFSIFPNNQLDDKLVDKILFIGHAYGSPELYNDEIDPSVKNYLNTYSTDNYKYIVWGGDFINDCNSSSEISNFFNLIPENIITKSLFIWGDHELECYNDESFKFLKNDENRVLSINNYDLFLINSNFNSSDDYKKVIDQINSSEKTKILFTHNVIFSKSNWLLRSNGRDFYDYGNMFYDEIPKEENLTIVTGDVGAIKGTPYLSFYKDDSTNLLSSGLGNGKNNFAVELVLRPDNIEFFSLNLDNNVTKELKPNYIMITVYNFFYYFFLSKKRAVLFFGIIILIFFIRKRNFFRINS